MNRCNGIDSGWLRPCDRFMAHLVKLNAMNQQENMVPREPRPSHRPASAVEV